MKNRGPRSKTLKNKTGKCQFNMADKGIKVSINIGISIISSMILTDSDIRKLRDWLNWYLDNK